MTPKPEGPTSTAHTTGGTSQARPAPLIIIGSGAAGLTAAIYAVRANLAPLVIAGLQPGGQMTITTDVENYPGFADPVQGPWLMQQMQQQAENLGVKVAQDLVTAVDFTTPPFAITCDSGATHTAQSIIIATGAVARWLGLASETRFQGKGVSACATCDGFFYRGKKVAVIGGGNTAVEEALYLANICESVTLIHRRDALRAEAVLQQRLFKTANVKIMWDHVAAEILGDPKGVTGLQVKSTTTGKTETLDVAGVFVAIGHDPATQVFRNAIALDKDGYIITKNKNNGGDKGVYPATQTSISGVFAAGDCVDKIYRQAVTAAGMGCIAALDAEKYLASI